MSRKPKIYMAGPEVFLPDAVAVGRAKVEACAALGMEGLFPLDVDLAGGPDLSTRIALGNMAAIRSCDAVVANVTPFRGLHADPGTAFECGFAQALGKYVFAYTNVPGTLATRSGSVPSDGRAVLPDGTHVEDFGHPENLMICETAMTEVADVEPDDPDRDLVVFGRSLETVAALYSSMGRIPPRKRVPTDPASVVEVTASLLEELREDRRASAVFRRFMRFRERVTL